MEKWLHLNDAYVQNLNPSQILPVIFLGHQRGFALIKLLDLSVTFFSFYSVVFFYRRIITTYTDLPHFFSL